ncbi:MAG: 4-(cytidine 5'-diphospho)-2-C-methyl-D-erythritol kinase [Cyclobacteriaceae bacterium]
MLQFPNAKINLGLRILRKRIDGYHDLETCFYPIDWKDILEIVPAKKMHFHCTGIEIPGDPATNLCLKAYKLLQKDFGLPNASIHLHKIIPMGAGLGGGSADAAYVLRLTAEIFNLIFEPELLKIYAAQIGSDCSFFIENTPSIATGRGEILEPANIDLSEKHFLVVHPGIHVATAAAYASVTPAIPTVGIKDIIENQPVEAWQDKLINDFELSVFNKYPEIENLKNKIMDLGAGYVAMSGSGSAVFGIFNDDLDIEGIFPEHYKVWQGKGIG